MLLEGILHPVIILSGNEKPNSEGLQAPPCSTQRNRGRDQVAPVRGYKADTPWAAPSGAAQYHSREPQSYCSLVINSYAQHTVTFTEPTRNCPQPCPRGAQHSPGIACQHLSHRASPPASQQGCHRAATPSCLSNPRSLLKPTASHQKHSLCIDHSAGK